MKGTAALGHSGKYGSISVLLKVPGPKVRGEVGLEQQKNLF